WTCHGRDAWRIQPEHAQRLERTGTIRFVDEPEVDAERLAAGHAFDERRLRGGLTPAAVAAAPGNRRAQQDQWCHLRMSSRTSTIAAGSTSRLHPMSDSIVG